MHWHRTFVVCLTLSAIHRSSFMVAENPAIGQSAAEESKDEIAALLKDTDMVFVTAVKVNSQDTVIALREADIAQDIV